MDIKEQSMLSYFGQALVNAPKQCRELLKIAIQGHRSEDYLGYCHQMVEAIELAKYSPEKAVDILTDQGNKVGANVLTWGIKNTNCGRSRKSRCSKCGK